MTNNAMNNTAYNFGLIYDYINATAMSNTMRHDDSGDLDFLLFFGKIFIELRFIIYIKFKG